MANCKAEVDEVCRVLAPNGVFLYLRVHSLALTLLLAELLFRRTWGQPHFRKRHLQREGWETEVVELGGESTFSYFLYVMRRTAK